MYIFRNSIFIISILFFQVSVQAQSGSDSLRVSGHTNTNKFKQLKQELATPNTFRTASGAPGRDYYQQQVDYDMDIELDDAKQKLYGKEEITYTNNSPDALRYLWVQLDQNIRKKDAPALEKTVRVLNPFCGLKLLLMIISRNLLMEDLTSIG
jgi:hypothetical protein